MLSPMGLPLAMLPPSVAVERIGGLPKRRSTSAKSGRSRATAVITRSSGTAAPMRQSAAVSSMRFISAMPPM